MSSAIISCICCNSLGSNCLGLGFGRLDILLLEVVAVVVVVVVAVVLSVVVVIAGIVNRVVST